MTARQRNPRDDLLLALHVEIVRSTHELYELRDLCESYDSEPASLNEGVQG
jgi:hypothetical protein